MSFAGSRHQCLVVLAEVLRSVPEIKGRIRIQKALYFIKRCGLQELVRVEFTLQSYGPFSHNVSSALLEGLSTGYFAEDTRQPGDDWQDYTYKLNNPGHELSAELGAPGINLIQLVTKIVDNEHWLALELASTVDFLVHEEGIPLAQAIERAVSMRPSTRLYTDKAIAILENLPTMHLRKTTTQMAS